jgi:hypothetical protein
MADSDTCPHCGHLWDNHDGLLTGSNRCDVCGCMWSEPKPPPEPPTERDLLTLRIAKVLYEGVRESCDGYVEGYEQYGDSDPTKEVVDGRVDFPAFAQYVIDAFIKYEQEMCQIAQDQVIRDVTDRLGQ